MSLLDPFLHTNYAATLPEELAAIQQVVIETNQNIQVIDDSIRHAREWLLSLERMKSDLEEYKRKHLAMSHPVRLLPSELWADIFVHCVQSVPIGPSAITKPPFTLSHVCQRWRSIALSAPGLWSSISLNINDQGLGQCQLVGLGSLNEFLALILSRSRNAPLTISFESNFTLYSTDTSRQFLEQLLVHSHRWKHASIQALPEHLVQWPDMDFPLLQSLVLRVTASDMSGRWLPEPIPISLFRQSPIAHLTLQGFPCNGDDHTLPERVYIIPWNGLASLHITITLPEHPVLLLAALRHTPMLQSLTIRSHSRKDNPWTMGTRVRLSELTSLSILNAPVAQMTLLTHIIAPKLKHLMVQHARFSPLSALIKASECTLESLAILRPRDLDLDQLYEFVKASLIEVLTIPYESVGYGNAALVEPYQAEVEHFLKWRLTGKTVLPALQALWLRSVSTVIQVPLGLEEFVRDRDNVQVGLSFPSNGLGHRHKMLETAKDAAERLQNLGCQVGFYQDQ